MATQTKLAFATITTDTSVGTFGITGGQAAIQDSNLSGTYGQISPGSDWVAKQYAGIQLVKANAAVGTAKAVNINVDNALNTPTTFGGDLWGTTLTAADVNSTGFGIQLQFRRSTGSPVSYKLRFTGYGFTLPENAVISAVTIRVATSYNDINLFLGGVEITVTYTTSIQRFAVASGNWNAPATWALTQGGPAGAPAPVAGDYVEINGNYTVTLTADAACNGINVSQGTLTMNNYKMSIGIGAYGYFYTSGAGAKTINLVDATLEMEVGVDDGILIGGTNVTFVANRSVTRILVSGDDVGPSTFVTGGKTWGDVFITMGYSSSSNISISGGGTFKSLSIAYQTAAAHTVQFAAGTYNVSRLAATGVSTSQRLTLKPVSGTATINFASGGAMFGQFLNIVANFLATKVAGINTPLYAGANSISAATGWLLQDPPKADTLIDPLTTAPASNTTRWDYQNGTPTLSNRGSQGGGYSASTQVMMTSKDTYDLLDSWFIYERVPSTETEAKYGWMWIVGGGGFGLANTTPLSGPGKIHFSLGQTQEDITYYVSDSTGNGGVLYTYPKTALVLIRTRIALVSGVYRIVYGVSTNSGNSWSESNIGPVLDRHQQMLYRSARIGNLFGSGANIVGSIGIIPNAIPTIAQDTPNATTFYTFTPKLEFTGTDAEGNELIYEIQVENT